MAEASQSVRWVRDLRRFLPLKSQFVLSGNIRDLQAQEVSAGTVAAVPLQNVLASELGAAGYVNVLHHQPFTGFRVMDLPGAAAKKDQLLSALGLSSGDARLATGPDHLGPALDRLVGFEADPTALIIDFASRLVVRNDSLSPAEHQLFSRALVHSHAARPRPAGTSRAP